MDKKYRLLYYLNRHAFTNQRALAAGTDMSLGQINALLRSLTDEGFLEKDGSSFRLTDRARSFLEDTAWQNRREKLAFEAPAAPVRTAVVLAAGANPNFECPVCLLCVGGVPLIDRTLRLLTANGIERIVVVAGYREERLRAHLGGRNVTFCTNPRYPWSGTMESLAAVRDLVKEDFLLVESNLIFEETAVRALLESDDPNSLILTVPSGSSDEAYVELASDGSLFRISKDICQLNRIDGEMIGVSRISLPLFRQMLEYFEENQNPYLNYEYVIENIGRIYRIPCIRMDDMAWTVIENPALYQAAESRVYPRIRRREQLRKENHAREAFLLCMGHRRSDLEEIRICGGMTNTNFYVKSRGEEYVLRMPGACTGQMIDRAAEMRSSRLASDLGLNVPTLYFDPENGVKITRYIPDAVTLNGKTARLEIHMKQTAALLRRLHRSALPLAGEFSVRKEYEKYLNMAAASGGSLYPEHEEMHAWFYRLLDRLECLGTDRAPCHNDLVAENLLVGRDGRMYLIDWEYAGFNDPVWDLASHLLECEFTPREEELFLLHYYGAAPGEECREKLLIFKTLLDILWSIWTVAKEANGEFFGSYGRDRLLRAKRLKAKYQRLYEKKEENHDLPG